MSEQDPTSTPKTSAVPLKKETVRITLRARPGAGVTQPREATSPVSPSSGGLPAPSTSSVMPPTAKRATAPIQLPSAPLPPPAPKASTAPVNLPPASAPPPPSAAPVTVPRATVPPRPPGAGGPPTAPRPAMPPKTETGAMTAPLAKAPGAPRPASPGAGTGPMVAGAGATGALPKATVKLQQTQPMARAPIGAPPSAPVKRSASADSEQFYDEPKDPDAGMMGISIVCLIASVVLLAVQLLGSDQIKAFHTPAGAAASSFQLPADVSVPWETKTATGEWRNTFKQNLPEIPQ